MRNCCSAIAPLTLALALMHGARRKVLVLITLTLGLVGIVLAAVPFMGSLQPSADAGRTLLHLNIRDFPPGQFTFFDNGQENYWGKGVYLVVRGYDEKFRLFELRTQDGQFVMPDVHWWMSAGICKDFGPELKDGRLAIDGVITCHDPELEDAARKQWRWDFDGKNLGTYPDSLFQPPFVVEGSNIIIGKRK